MTKLSLDVVFSKGYGRPVLAANELHVIKWIVGQRKKAVEADPSLLERNRWNLSTVFYKARTHLNNNGWDTSVYNASPGGGESDRRKGFYEKIKSVCEIYYGVKRHQIGIYPSDRAVMTFQGNQYSVSFDNLQYLMDLGTDVVFVEKNDIVTICKKCWCCIY